MPLSDTDLAATSIDDGSFISDPYDKPAVDANAIRRPRPPPSSRPSVFGGRLPNQAPSNPNAESSIITIERLRQERLHSNLMGGLWGAFYGFSTLYLCRFHPSYKKLNRNHLTLIFFTTFSFTSTLSAGAALQRRMRQLQLEARQQAIARGEIPDPNSPDRLFDTSRVGDSPSGLASPEEAGWSGLGRSGAEGQPGFQGRPTEGQPQWYRGAAAQRPRDAQGEQEQEPMSWAERQRRANPMPDALRDESTRLGTGIR